MLLSCKTLRALLAGPASGAIGDGILSACENMLMHPNRASDGGCINAATNPHLVAAPEVEARQRGQLAERPHGAVGDGAAVCHVQALQVLRTVGYWVRVRLGVSLMLGSGPGDITTPR